MMYWLTKRGIFLKKKFFLNTKQFFYFGIQYQLSSFQKTSKANRLGLIRGAGGGGLVTKLCLTLVIPWTVACQAPLSMGSSRQEHWSGLPFPSPGDLPDPGIEPVFPALQADDLPSELWGKPKLEGLRHFKIWKQNILYHIKLKLNLNTKQDILVKKKKEEIYCQRESVKLQPEPYNWYSQ